MSEYYIHITSENDRWDTIATQYYGNCYEISEIIEENPHIPIIPVLGAGIQIKVPVKETVNNINKPEWKKI